MDVIEGLFTSCVIGILFVAAVFLFLRSVFVNKHHDMDKF